MRARAFASWGRSTVSVWTLCVLTLEVMLRRRVWGELSSWNGCRHVATSRWKGPVLVRVLCSMQLLGERGRGKAAACGKASGPKQEKQSVRHLQWFSLLIVHWETTV